MSRIALRSAPWASQTKRTARAGPNEPRKIRSVSADGNGERARTSRAISSADLMRPYDTTEAGALRAHSHRDSGASREQHGRSGRPDDRHHNGDAHQHDRSG